jgi:hypothetical protein
MATPETEPKGDMTTCPNCGRMEVTGSYCTFCFRPTDGESGFPASHPTMAYGQPRDRAIDYIPREYRGASQWPEVWGPYPFGDENV